jgi:hypothetical protein
MDYLRRFNLHLPLEVVTLPEYSSSLRTKTWNLDGYARNYMTVSDAGA